jgi:DNA polymerase-3 subunit delta'
MNCFPDLIGNLRVREHIVRTLCQHPSHAYLFAGPEGVGKYHLAVRFAQGLACPQAIEQPCSCQSCRQIAAGTHPDVHLLLPQGDTVKLEEAKRLRDWGQFQPLAIRWVINIIDQADRLTAEASASLLKLLEEPPPQVINILVTSRPQFLLPTILSRCQRLSFQSVPTGQIEQWLRQQGCTEAEAVARIAAGRPAEALRWAEKDQWKKRQRYLEWSLQVASDNSPLAVADKILKEKDKQTLVDFLSVLLSLWRDLAVGPFDLAGVVNRDQATNIIQVAAGRPSYRWAEGCLSIEETLELLGTPVNMTLRLPALLLVLAQT